VETRTGVIKGKVTYMAPEQAASGDVDSRADIYSVGVMLWQAAARKRRWKDVANNEVLQRLLRGDVAEAPNAMAHGLPSIVDSIVLKAIAPDPERRYATAKDLRKALEDLLVQMKDKTSIADVGDVIAREFAQERARADDVIKSRLAKLDDESLTAAQRDLDSETSIRSAVQVSPSSTAAVSAPFSSSAVQKSPSAAQKSPSRRPSSAGRVEVGGAASRLEAKIRQAEAPRIVTSPDATVPSRRKNASAKRMRRITLGVVGLAAACALAYGIVRMRASRSLATSAAHAPAAAAAIAPPTTTTTELPPAQDTRQAPTAFTQQGLPPAMTRERSRIGSGRRGTHAEPSPAAADGSHAAPVAIPAQPQPPPTTAQSTSPSLPSIDKQDPWSRPHPAMGNDDPWK
ncbi:MAG: protein kinase, partial [Polyangiaceae bacterium]